MRSLLIVVGFGLLVPAVGFAACADPVAVATTRDTADTECPCAAATSHGAYKRCVAGVAAAAVDAETLPPECRTAVVRCASRSTCGRADAVTCCRTNSHGETRCSVKRDATKCRAPSGGAACTGTVPSCCDACDAGGCVVPTTTTTTSTTLPPVCGNGTIEAGELCDGSALGICQRFGPPHCGDPAGPSPCQCCLQYGEAMLFGEDIPCCDGGTCELTGPPSMCVCGCIPLGSFCGPQMLPCCAGACVDNVCQ